MDHCTMGSMGDSHKNSALAAVLRNCAHESGQPCPLLMGRMWERPSGRVICLQSHRAPVLPFPRAEVQPVFNHPLLSTSSGPCPATAPEEEGLQSSELVCWTGLTATGSPEHCWLRHVMEPRAQVLWVLCPAPMQPEGSHSES